MDQVYTYTVSSHEKVEKKNASQYSTFPSPLQYIQITKHVKYKYSNHFFSLCIQFELLYYIGIQNGLHG